ncbi:serine hydrolase domain-containing protein [Vallitalea okinawensis]|uniref:serine hydrolase domain-containing protein n=1 Tax=Vallitalea okinawensis TaxID=2078660 RepID=UPI0013003208|nr:serine hydrolase domain-containing protein [Vallitalea okinawensis]
MKCTLVNHKLVQKSDALVPWWSFGKTALATCVLKLVEENQLSLSKHYFGQAGTLEQVLRHESGLKDYYCKAYLEAVERNEIPWTFDVLLEKTNSQILLGPAGKQFHYSNIGYYYIRRLVENTMDMPLEKALYALIFDELKIKDVFVAINPEDLKVCTQGIKKEYHPSWLYHGMIIGSLNSACIFLDYLASGKIISSDMLEHMKDAYMIPFDIGNRPWQKPGYGLGLMIDAVEGRFHSFGHTGSGPGSTIAVYHFPNVNSGMTVAATSESSDQSIVENKVTNLIKIH